MGFGGNEGELMRLPHIDWRTSAGVLVMIGVFIFTDKQFSAGFWFLYPVLVSVFYWPSWVRRFRAEREQRIIDARFNDLIDYNA